MLNVMFENLYLVIALFFSALVIFAANFKNHEACKPEKRKLRSAWFMEDI